MGQQVGGGRGWGSRWGVVGGEATDTVGVACSLLVSLFPLLTPGSHHKAALQAEQEPHVVRAPGLPCEVC